MADGWIELFDVETDEAELLLVFDRFEPVDYGCGVFPLVEVVFFRDCAVDAVEDVFADFAYLGLRGVDESAGRFVCEVRLYSSHSPHNSSSKRCNLCLKEKFLIICRPELSTLNKRNELVSSCRHRNKALLRNN